jgi:hypothetical protein
LAHQNSFFDRRARIGSRLSPACRTGRENRRAGNAPITLRLNPATGLNHVFGNAVAACRLGGIEGVIRRFDQKSGRKLFRLLTH